MTSPCDLLRLLVQGGWRPDAVSSLSAELFATPALRRSRTRAGAAMPLGRLAEASGAVPSLVVVSGGAGGGSRWSSGLSCGASTRRRQVDQGVGAVDGAVAQHGPPGAAQRPA